MKFTVKTSGQTFEFDTLKRGDDLVISVDGRELTATVRHVDHNEAVLDLNGRRITLKRHRSGQKRQLWVNGRTLSYERLQEQGGSAAEGGGTLSAEIPAIVSQILVEIGQDVTSGEKLILLESMKMVIPLIAPADGTVTAVLCQEGDAVQPGVTLVEIDTK